MKSFIVRIVFGLRVLLNKKQEPLFSWAYLLRYVANGYFFPSYQKQNFKNDIQLKQINNEKYIYYKGAAINYPSSWNNKLIVENFNNLINEQTAVAENINPHKYLLNKQLKSYWVVYDLGAAEGSQSKYWINQVSQIVMFEPLPSFYAQLQKTFKDEITNNKAIIINAGVTNKETIITLEGKAIEFNTLEALIRKYNLPLPHYIKADIEGEELNFLTSSINILNKTQMELVEITTYHRPVDHITIPIFFKQFNGQGSFSTGVMVFNRDGLISGHYRKKIYHPVIRKCLYSFEFN